MSNIPTIEIDIGKGNEKLTIKIYKWLSQDSENEYMSILAGDTGIDTSQDLEDTKNLKVGIFKVKASLKNIYKAQQYLLKNILIIPTYEEFNVMQPSVREEISRRVDKQHNKKK